jgi:hypothetical protein
MNLLTKFGILSLLAVSTISLPAIAETITETPNRPEENPFQDCEEDIVRVRDPGDDDLFVYFENGGIAYLFFGEPVMYTFPHVYQVDGGTATGAALYTEEYLCPEEVRQYWEVEQGLSETDTIKETVKSEDGQNYLQSQTGESWYESQHPWMQDQVDEWTREYNTEHAPECPTNVVKEYSNGFGNPGASELTLDEIRFLENLLGDGDSEDSAIAIPNL